MAVIRTKRLRIALDFDGVLHDYLHPVAGKKMGEPVPGSVAGVTALVEAGHDVTVFTTRGNNPGHVIKWMLFYGFPLLPVTNIKQEFDYIVDDRAVRFDHWPLTEVLGPVMVSTSEKSTAPLAEPGSTPGGSTETPVP
jgi:hypothetical protein